jgi:hypoxanthine phosphoribosyltransferase
MLKQLDKIDDIVDGVKSLTLSYKEISRSINEKKNEEHAKRSYESVAEADGEKSVEIKIESKTDTNKHKKIPQKVSKGFIKFRRDHVVKSTISSASIKASLKVPALAASEAHVSELKRDPHQVFRRKKKYKCDDGG